MKSLSIVLLAIVLVAIGAYYAFPLRVAESLLRLARRKLGLVKKVIEFDEHTLTYLEGGGGSETIVLLHGFAGNKDHWLAIAPYLKDYHLLIPDLPGHGESSRCEEASYDTSSQIDRLHRFVRQLHLGRFHLAGNSMGGMLSAAYAARYPEDVLSIALLNSAGVRAAQPSEAAKLLERGENPLMLESEADFDRLSGLVFFKPPFMPFPLREMSVSTALANNAFNQKMLKEIVPEAQALEAELPRIAAPTLILWGAQDRFLDVSSVAVFENGLRNHQTVILQDCGHVPMIEKPRETADAYLAFLRGLAG